MTYFIFRGTHNMFCNWDQSKCIDVESFLLDKKYFQIMGFYGYLWRNIYTLRYSPQVVNMFGILCFSVCREEIL